MEIVQRFEPVLLLFCFSVSLVEKNDALKKCSLDDDDDNDDDDDDDDDAEEEEEEDQCK